MDTSALTERLLAAAGDRTYRSIADLTATNAETVRRYMQGQAPSVEFLAAICSALGISEQWLISGRGPMRANQLKSHALKDASPSELLSAMAGTIERIAERVDRLELFITSMEARLRVRVSPSPGVAPGVPIAGAGIASVSTRPNSDVMVGSSTSAVKPAHSPDTPDGSASTAAESTTAAQRARRAGHIADAVAKRPRPDAG